jgi:hypothetical protein
MTRPLQHPTRPAPAVLLAGAASIAIVLAAGCSRPDSAELQPGSYRATVELPGDKIVPFGLDVAREERGPVLYLVNGKERVRVEQVTVTRGRLTATLPGLGARLEADLDGDRLGGTIEMPRPGASALRMPFAAQYGATWRFYEAPRSDNADLAGRWAVTYTDTRGERAAGVMELDQQADDVTGTTRLSAADEYRLAGEVYDEELRLSRFDGATVVLYEARLDAQGRLAGEAWSDRAGRRSFVAVRNPDAAVDGVAESVGPTPTVTVPQAVFTREN